MNIISKYTENGSEQNHTLQLSNNQKVDNVTIFTMKIPDDLEYIYADGYQMLSQYKGKKSLHPFTYFTDKNHYKMPQISGAKIYYNYMWWKEKNGGYTLVGATSCNKFRSELVVKGNVLEFCQALEGLSYNGNIELENTVVISGNDLNEVLDIYASMLQKNHPPKKVSEIPQGWCSWYCVGEKVTEKIIFDNLNCIKEKMPELKYIQIDDGFQPYMGDWLLVGNKFGRDMKSICLDIKNQGFEPAVWVAPFIASPKSKLFNEHKDWFIKNDKGEPLCSKDVTFEGWRDSPWYFLDMSNEQAGAYIKEVFSTMYNDWGVKYFKLDANAWGGLPFGKRKDESITSVEHYRIGMEHIWNSVGDDAYVLGCNAPMFPSLGLVSGMRVTGDIARNMLTAKSLTQECFHRNWMNNKLWLNDPDCLIQADTKAVIIDGIGDGVRKKPVKKNYYQYQNIYVAASGGVLLGSDHMNKLSSSDFKIMHKILALKNNSAKFNLGCTIGETIVGNKRNVFIFNSKYLPKVLKLENQNYFDEYKDKPIKLLFGKYLIVKPSSAKWLSVNI